jgi:hypothetical protein
MHPKEVSLLYNNMFCLLDILLTLLISLFGSQWIIATGTASAAEFYV